MSDPDVLALVRQVLITGLVVSLPLLFVISVAGLGISLVQALTQIQEQAVAFVAKLLLAGLTLWLVTPWMLQQLLDLIRHAILNMAVMAR